ncbi:thiol reductant ABC exporter subunit CydC [Lacticaseibacillus sp. GG6-2]
MWQNDHWVRPDLKRYRGLLVWSLVFGGLTFVCAGALMFTSGYLIDFSARMPLFAAIYVPVVLTRAFGLGRPVFQYLQRLTSHNWVFKITSHMRRRLYLLLAQKADDTDTMPQTGDVIGLLADDIGHVQNLYLRTLFPTIVAGGLTLVCTLAVGIFDWRFAIVIGLLLLCQIALIPFWRLGVEAARKRQQKALTHNAYVTVTDHVLGLGDWVLARRRKDFLDRTTTDWKALSASQSQSNRSLHLRIFIARLAFGLLPIVLLWWSALRFTATASAANWVGAIVLTIFPLEQAFASLSTGIAEWPTHQASLKRLNALQPPAVNLPEQQPVPADFGCLRLDDVTFTYPHTPTALLTHLDLEVPKGKKIALLGPSGMGKTTIIDLLMGDLKPDSGAVLLDETAISAYQTHRQDLFAVLEQQPHLFNTSIKNNIRLGNLAATDAQIADVIAKVQLTELIANLPQGLETPVAEAGLNFSGGERQRLALARILLQDAPIVVLDEPTVGLDPLIEQELIETMFTTLADKTLVWITHHLQGVARCDQVYFLEDGRFTMQGAPAQLAATNARYRQLLALDAGWTSADAAEKLGR